MTDRPPADAPEHVRAKWWRTEVLGVSRDELADLTGYSVSAITMYENGRRYDGKPLSLDAITRYRTACAAIEARVRFAWLSCKVDKANRRKL